MCDDLTAVEEEAALARQGVSRRDFAAMSAALGASGALAACTTAGTAGGAALTESMVSIPTGDGQADAFFVHPGKGKHPGVVMWPDIAGLRPAYMEMARRLAAAGYAVLAVNHYYRNARAPIMQTMAEWRTPEGQAKLKPMIAAITPNRTMADAKAFVAWLDKQAAVDTAKGIGTQGYCMGGPYTVRTAAAVPSRVRQACSFHGGGLVTAEPDSPHKLLAATNAEFLFAIAQNDDAKAPGDKDALRSAAAYADRKAEIEVYPADHGWCTIDAPVYNRDQAERAWARLLDHYSRL